MKNFKKSLSNKISQNKDIARLWNIDSNNNTNNAGDHSYTTMKHFVRLSSHTAQRLYDRAHKQALERRNIQNHSIIDNGSNNTNRWSILDETKFSSRCTSGIEFLPITITFDNSDVIIYTSYNGGNLDISHIKQGTFVLVFDTTASFVVCLFFNIKSQ